MLLIGDIHITSRYADKILSELKSWIESHPSEQNIIFLGDYVYHFSYDRNALLALYSFLIKLFEQGKNVYVLAGNHDWLGNNFVFEEAKKAFEVILNFKGEILNSKTLGHIKFITQPMLEEIEGEKILFLPYMIDQLTVNNEQLTVNSSKYPNISGTIQLLSASKNKNEKLSARVNSILLEAVEENTNLTVIHHYYFNTTKFPGQKSVFNYKDLALCEGFLDLPNIKMISGHLHQAFAMKNYVCTGSVRSSSSLESNQTKYLFCYKDQKLEATSININPYLVIDEETILDEQNLQKKYQAIAEENRKNLLGSESRKINFVNEDVLNLKDLSLSLKVKDVDYENIDSFIDSKLRMQIKDIKLKKNMQDMGDLIKNLETSGKNLSTSFADRKEILKSYLQSKYGDASTKYEEILHEMKLL